MRHHNTKEMLSYWNSLFETANAGRASHQRPVWPERCDLQPADCRTLLPHMFILDLQNSAVKYRLAGTQLCALHGRELKLESYPSLFIAEDQQACKTWVTHLDIDEIIVLMCTVAENERGETVSLETLLMPLNNNGNGQDRVLGITSAYDPESWVGHMPIKKQTVRSVRILKPWENKRHGLETPMQNISSIGQQKIPADIMSQENIVPFNNNRIPSASVLREEIKRGPDFANEFHTDDHQAAIQNATLRKLGHLQLIKGGKEKPNG